MPKSPLHNQFTMNAALRDADEAVCHAMLAAEKAGKNRRSFLLRIHSRLNKVRADRERAEIIAGTESDAA